jgi:hypothetical protein
MTRYGPHKLRKTQTLRMLVNVLDEHYRVRPAPDGMVEYNGNKRREAWEVRL